MLLANESARRDIDIARLLVAFNPKLPEIYQRRSQSEELKDLQVCLRCSNKRRYGNHEAFSVMAGLH